MSLLDFLKGNHQAHVADVADWTPANPRKSSWFQETSKANAAGMPVNQETAMNSSAAFACTRARSETLASLPAVVYEHADGDERRRARQNPLWALLHDQPNPQMDSMNWYGLAARRMINRGNAVNVIEFNGRGLPIALWPVHNSRFEIYRQPSRQGNGGRYFPGEVFYRIWPDETDRHYDVHADEVLNIVGGDSEDGLIGRGVIDRARHELGLDLAQQEYAGSMFKNGAIPLGLITHPWIEDETDRNNFRADINSLHGNRENWNRVGILWNEQADWKNLNFNPKDVQAIESRIFTAKSICRFYDVPPAIVQIFDDYKFATVEAMLKHFVILRVRCDAVRFERAFNSQLISNIPDDAQVFLEFALEGLLRGDPKAQAEANAILRQWGILNADEWRQRDLNLNPLPDGVGQAYLAPLNYATLDTIVAGNAPGQGAGNSQQAGDTLTSGANPAWSKGFLAAIIQAVTAGKEPPAITQARSASEGAPLPAVIASDDFAAGFRTENWEIEDAGHEQALITKCLRRMCANDARAIRRLAKAGPTGFLDRMNAHYAKFEAAVKRAVAEVAEAGSSALIAAKYCAAGKQFLLFACECQPEQFMASIEACLEHWPTRNFAAEILSPTPDS